MSRVERGYCKACLMSDVHHLWPCMQQSAVSVMPASWEVVCGWAPHPVLSIISGLSNTTTVVRRSCRTHENCMHAEHIIIIFHIIFFIFRSMYLVLFSIVLYRTIVTVYTDNVFLYNYVWEMHQKIHFSPVDCFIPARGKTVQKTREASGVNWVCNCKPKAAIWSRFILWYFFTTEVYSK